MHVRRLFLPSGRSSQHEQNRWLVLGVLCAAVYLINASTTLMNVTLPTLVVKLDAGTTDLL